MKPHPVLFAGGSGVVGRAALRWFRERHPDVPTLVGGRDLRRARDSAREAGATGAVAIDLDRAGIGLDGYDPSAVIVFAPDHALHGMRYAQDRGIPYVSGSTWLAEAGAEMALYAHRPNVPVLLASHWWGGAAMFLALRDAKRFDQLRTIRIGAVVDERDSTGPAAIEDMARSGEGATTALALEHGHRVWLAGDTARGRVQAIDGRTLDTEAYAPLDIASLHAATGASSIRFDLAIGTSSSRLRGGPIAAEVIVELEGDVGGVPRVSRSTLEFPGGQASITALSVTLSLPALLGLDGRTPAQPGIYLPELLSDTDWFLGELAAAGAVLRASSE